MRDCLFLVADKNMEGMLKGFFSRQAFHHAMGVISNSGMSLDGAQRSCAK